MQALFHAAREYLTPVLKESAFIDKGMLTPEEFVRAGDHLTRVAPTWEWKSGDASKARPYLPAGKQFLLTKRVPCYRRVSTLQKSADESSERQVMVEASEWIEPSLQAFGTGHDIEETAATTPTTAAAVAMSTPSKPASELEPSVPSASGAGAQAAVESDDDDYADMSSFVGSTLLTAPDMRTTQPQLPTTSAASADTSAHLLKVRSYDLSITYDNYYRTPRVYLQGYSESGAPLTPESMLQDIMQDYAQRTATIELHPHLPDAGPHISIHPCRHAQAMKRILDGLVASNTGDTAAETPTVEAYLFIFLKFIASMIPTIEYDYTVAVKVAGT